MKKSAIAISILLSSLTFSFPLQAKNQWYIGTQSGWSRLNLLSPSDDSIKIEYNASKNKLSAPILGMFLGYNINSYLGFEVSSNTIGSSPLSVFHKNKNTSQFNIVQMSTKLSYPLGKNVNVYTKLGGSAFWDDIIEKKNFKNILTKNTFLIPSISVGTEYNFNDHIFTRIDYTWKNSIKNLLDFSIKPTTGDIVLSLGWKFSGIDNYHTPLRIAKVVEKPYVTLNESINFPFDSNKITPSSYEKLNKLKDKIKLMKLKNISIILSGYSDNIGDVDYNQTLSEERAYSIRNYLESQGFSKNIIRIKGMGSEHPITEKACKNIRNQALLVSCLAPDRRVDIEILGTN